VFTVPKTRSFIQQKEYHGNKLKASKSIIAIVLKPTSKKWTSPVPHYKDVI
jgi:hypothetical protein